MIRASMRASEKVSGWPFELRYFWTQLWGYCDDFGRGRYDTRLLKAGVIPLDDDVTPERVGRWMQALELAGVIQAYEVGGKRYFECVNWHEHQESPYFRRTDVPGRDGSIPTPGKRSEVLQNILESFSRIEGEGKRKEGEGKSTPTPFCSKHPEGTDTPCRACKTARLKFEAGEVKATVPGIITDADCVKHPGRPARGCDRCAEEAIAS